jgi:CBS domain-containing protein
MSSRVSDIMNPKLLYIRDGDRLSLARAKIVEFGVTAVPILDDEHKPVGVVSLRDLAGNEPRATRPARVVRGDASLEEGARALANSGLHHLVVVDGGGTAIGIVSAVDFVRAFVGDQATHPAPFARF